jgi:hypothetical protein
MVKASGLIRIQTRANYTQRYVAAMRGSQFGAGVKMRGKAKGRWGIR